MTINDVEIRNPEFGDQGTHDPRDTSRIVGTTVKTVRRETPHGYSHTYTVRGLCLADKDALITELLDTLGVVVLVNGSQAIIHDTINVEHESAGYKVSFTVEYIVELPS